MIKNVGITDRIIRFVVMDALLGLSFLGFELPSWTTTVAAVISGVLLVTIISGYSPLYHALGFSTHFIDQDNEGDKETNEEDS